MFLVTQPVIA